MTKKYFSINFYGAYKMHKSEAKAISRARAALKEADGDDCEWVCWGRVVQSATGVKLADVESPGQTDGNDQLSAYGKIPESSWLLKNKPEHQTGPTARQKMTRDEWREFNRVHNEIGAREYSRRLGIPMAKYLELMAACDHRLAPVDFGEGGA